MSTHTVTITEVAPGSEDFEWKSTCTNDDGMCEVWYECKDCSHQPTQHEIDASEHAGHGTEHHFMDDAWRTKANECALSSTDSGAQGMLNLAHSVGVGTHQVDVSYWGDGEWTVLLIATEPEADTPPEPGELTPEQLADIEALPCKFHRPEGSES